MSLQITASLSGGTLTVNGSGWPAGGTATVQATDLYAHSKYGQATADDHGGFTCTIENLCNQAGEVKVAATNGAPQPGAEYNYEWSNTVSVMCQAPPMQPDDPDDPDAPDDPPSDPPSPGPSPGADASSWGEQPGDDQGW